MRDRPLIVNATAIGRRVDGIAIYGVNLVKALWRAGAGRPITVVLNEDARCLFAEVDVPAASVRWVSARMSPSFGTSGNLRRWLFANRLSLAHRDAIVFGLSQIEATFAGGHGVVTVHDMIPWLFPASHPRQHLFYRHYLGRALRHAAAIVTPSQATRDDVCRQYGIQRSRVRVIPHGSPVPLAGSAVSAFGRGRYILWIGRSDHTKNLAAVLAAFRIIARDHDLRLVMAGEGSPLDRTAIGAADTPRDRITLLGPVSESEKIALLDDAAVLVCPSLYEGFGFTPLEAMARGCPVVAAPAGAVPEVCGDAVLYADPRDPRLIADAVLRVIDRSDLARRLVDRGHERAIGFTWDASVRAHLAVFDEVARLQAGGQPTPASADRSRAEANVLP
jgi:glycosyltransferase involved in cell wall biosynthesis